MKTTSNPVSIPNSVDKVDATVKEPQRTKRPRFVIEFTSVTRTSNLSVRQMMSDGLSRILANHILASNAVKWPDATRK